MAFAVVDIAGSQQKVSKGDTIKVPVMSAEKGDRVKFDSVLLVSGKEAKVGTPYVDGAYVETKIVGGGRSEKIRVFTMKHRKRRRRTQGHRQGYTEIEILKIGG